MHEDNQALIGALRAGAQGYLLKGADRTEITDFYTGAHHDHAATVFPELTGRERQVLELVAAGDGNHEIARRLMLSEKTVRNHVSAIFYKLHARTAITRHLIAIPGRATRLDP